MLPWVIIYNAVSLDGRITGFDADVELYYELASKWDVDAVLMGNNTVLTGSELNQGKPLRNLKKPFNPGSKKQMIGHYWWSLIVRDRFVFGVNC